MRSRVRVFALALLLLAGCTSEDGTRTILESAGFSKVEVDGHAWLACGGGVLWATSFSATNPLGDHVSGAVCCRPMEACTVLVQ
jgi:hypothetical protein